eukprot:1609344-Prymnesium_polylepis.1
MEDWVTLTFNASTLQRCIIPWRPYTDYRGGQAAAVWATEGVHQSYSESLVAECFAVRIGGIYVKMGSTLDVMKLVVRDCHAFTAAGISIVDCPFAYFAQCQFLRCTSESTAGAMDIKRAKVDMHEVSFVDCQAGSFAGG